MATNYIPDGEPVYIYWNLHKHCFSVRSRSKQHGYRVIAHVDRFSLSHAEFRVSKAGRDQVLREKKKNVHAGIAGTWINSPQLGGATPVTYNPYKAATFVIKDSGKAIRKADEVNGRIVDSKPIVLV